MCTAHRIGQRLKGAGGRERCKATHTMSAFFADLSAAVKDGVKEFSATAIQEVTETVKEGTQTVVAAPQKIIESASNNSSGEARDKTTGEEDGASAAGEGSVQNPLKRFP